MFVYINSIHIIPSWHSINGCRDLFGRVVSFRFTIYMKFKLLGTIKEKKKKYKNKMNKFKDKLKSNYILKRWKTFKILWKINKILNSSSDYSFSKFSRSLNTNLASEIYFATWRIQYGRHYNKLLLFFPIIACGYSFYRFSRSLSTNLASDFYFATWWIQYGRHYNKLFFSQL